MAPPKLWKCDVCGYVHEGEEPPETCPVCGVGPEMFSSLEAVASSAPTPSAGRWRCTICDYEHEGDEPPDPCPVCGAARGLFEATAEQRASAAGEDVGAIVIVGAGVAGVTAAEHARRTAPAAAVTLVGKEPHAPYYRLNLSRRLAGEVEEDALALKPAAWYEQQRIELRTGEVRAIDRQARQLQLRDGTSLGFERLVLATGAHAFVPPLAGVRRDNVFVLRTLDDTRALLEVASAGRRCVCIGGGLLGLEAAGALSRRGVAVTVLEGFEHLLPRQLPRAAAEMLREHLGSLGIAVRCGVKVKAIAGDEAVRAVKLEDEDEIAADFVVLATGVRPNSHLARQSGLQVKSGVIVDERMATSDPAIFAAGDVAEHGGVVYGIWPASFTQGQVAGTNAAGGAATFRALPPSTRLKVLDVDVFSVGRFRPEDASYAQVEQRDLEAGTYRRYVCRDGQLVGAVLYGDTSLSGPLKEAVERGGQLLEDPDLLDRVPELADLCRGA